MRRLLVAIVLALLVLAPAMIPWWWARDAAAHEARERAQEDADRLAADAQARWQQRSDTAHALLDVVCAGGATGELRPLALGLEARRLVVQERGESAWLPASDAAVPGAVFGARSMLGAASVRGVGVLAVLGCERDDLAPARRAWIGWRLALPMLDDPSDGVAHGDAGVALATEIPEALLARSAQRDVLSFDWVAPARSSYATEDSAVPRLVAWSVVRAQPVAFPYGAVIAAIVAAMLGLAFGGGPRTDRKLEAAARRVGEGDLDVTLDGSSPTASAFNRMTRELKDARVRLARAERIAAWRDIARRIAHEIKNPLTPIKMAMETLRKTHARKHPDFDEIFDESTKTVLEETARLENIVTEFSRFARMPRPKAESMDVVDVAERVVSMHDLPAAAATLPEAAKGVRVELVKEERIPSVRADREQLTQVLVNVVQNACDAAREKQGETGGRVIVRVERGENDGVRVSIEDNGPGIPADARAAVLEPYYTTKSHGTGLGLSIVDRIVSDHGGTLTLADSSELGGAAIVLALRREGPSDEPESSVGV